MNTKNTNSRMHRKLMGDIKRHRAFYALLILPVGYFLIFKYLPIWNGQIAFRDFMPLDGVFGSRWVGLDNFKAFFRSFYFTELLRNTLFYSFMKLIVSVPLSIILAVALYECTRPRFSKLVQTIT